VKNRKGFTLIELAVALAIGVVVVGVVIVRVDGWSSKGRLRGSARALGNTIRLYREKAQSEEAVYQLAIDVEKGTYSVAVAGEKVRTGKLKAGHSFGKVSSGGIEMKSPFQVAFGPRGILPEIQIPIQDGPKDAVLLTLSSLANEVTYSERP
jgi:prepilin-type N-terminal cleavage/methylation domain-containing protein